MYNVLIVLLHRPFIADGHLYSTTRSISINSLITCASAADSIVALLRTYDRTFSIRRAPYLISYSCYVAATIHARIAAKRSPDSEAHANLETCLGVFRENQETNWAVRRAHDFIKNLMKRLGVTSEGGPNNGQQAPAVEANGQAEASDGFEDSNAEPPAVEGPCPDSPGVSPPLSGWPDIDGIIQSFARGQDPVPPGAQDAHGFTMSENSMHTKTMGVAAVQSGVESRAPDFRQPMDDANTAWSWGLQDGGAASIDDLLFGFNAALDSTPFFDMNR